MVAHEGLDRGADARIIVDDEDASRLLRKFSNPVRDLLRREFHENLLWSPSRPSRYGSDKIRDKQICPPGATHKLRLCPVQTRTQRMADPRQMIVVHGEVHSRRLVLRKSLGMARLNNHPFFSTCN